MNTLLLLGAISGSGLLNTVVILIVVGLVVGLLWWAIDYFKLPEPISKGAKIVLVLGMVLFLINALLSLIGHPFITW